MQNHMIERSWVEVNQQVNYPIKAVLIQMLEAGVLHEDPLHDYCLSWLVIQVANVRLTRFIAAWNSHPIPGREI